MPMPYDLLSPHLQALVAAAGLATACSVIDAAQTRVGVDVSAESQPEDARSGMTAMPQRARLLLPPNR